MNFSFGIITDGTSDERVKQIIFSIEKQSIPNYEIIVVGNSKCFGKNVKIIPFDETTKPAWITKKKNLITQNSQYDNIVFMHDYIKIEENWYKGFLSFGNDFKVCMTKILNYDGTRYRDWSICAWAPILEICGLDRRYERLLPYNATKFSDIMYFSGAYWVAKKEVMEKFPLNEALCWGQSEDIEWSYRIRKNMNFSMNQHSSVKLLKSKNPSFYEIKSDLLEKFDNMPKAEYEKIILQAEKNIIERFYFEKNK